MGLTVGLTIGLTFAGAAAGAGLALAVNVAEAFLGFGQALAGGGSSETKEYSHVKFALVGAVFGAVAGIVVGQGTEHGLPSNSGTVTAEECAANLPAGKEMTYSSGVNGPECKYH